MHRRIARKIGTDLAIGIDRKMPHDLVSGTRLAEPSEPGHLALVPVPDEAERIGEVAVEQADAVDPEGMQQRLIAAGEDLERTASRRGDAVGDVVADAV